MNKEEKPIVSRLQSRISKRSALITEYEFVRILAKGNSAFGNVKELTEDLKLLAEEQKLDKDCIRAFNLVMPWLKDCMEPV